VQEQNLIFDNAINKASTEKQLNYQSINLVR